MFGQELATRGSGKAGVPGSRRLPDRRRGPLTLLTAVTSGLSLARESRTVRDRFEQELRTLAGARSVSLRDEAGGNRAALGVDVPGIGSETRARLEVAFEPGKAPDAWTNQLLETAAHVAALLLEVERAQGRFRFLRSRSDGAAPLIGCSRAIKSLRERIERVAATDFTVLVEGESGIWQRARGAPNPRSQSPATRPVRGGELRGDRRDAARSGAVRDRRPDRDRRAWQARQVRACARRDAVPR